MSDALIVRHAEDVLRVVHGGGTVRNDGGHRAIDQSWSRCVNDYRLDPSRLYAPTVVDTDRLKERQTQHDELVEIARAEMDFLWDQISCSGYALLLTDASGIILCEKMDPTLKKMFRSAGLLVGADWSEQREGTNGIGTCIAEGRSITVHRADHFRARHIGLSCSGAPIRDAGGDVVAVLDASSVDAHDTRGSQTHTMALVNLSAQLIEKCLFLRRNQHLRILRFHHRPELVNLLHDGALAIGDDGRIVAADATACKLLGASHRRELTGCPVAEVFDTADRVLDRPSGRALWPLRDMRNGRRYFASLHDAGGRTLIQPELPVRETRTVVEVPSAEAPKSSAAGMTLEHLAGNDPQMLSNVRSARRIAGSTVPVLIQGPTGAGKEAFARALHLASPRAAMPFVAINCAAIPESLIESELFGYKPGAFTGARREGMKGKILQSSGGTLMLDEIGDMPLSLQTRLLRVLEEQEIVPLGSETPIKVDLRVISASHRNLRKMIADGQFREDLYYRLNGITMELPSLAQRTDKERLIREFLALETLDGRPAALEMDAYQCLLAYQWPGNIRELRNVLRTALAICEGGLVKLSDLPREIREPTGVAAAVAALPAPAAASLAASASTPAEAPSGNPLELAEREALLRAIAQHRGNMSATAAQLGMSRNTLYRKIRKHGIPLQHGRPEVY